MVDAEAEAEVWVVGPADVEGVGLGEHVRVAATVRFDFPTLNAAAEFWTRTAGHLQTERQRLDSQGVWDRLLIDLKRCFADANTDRTGRIVVDSTYLLATVEPAPVP
jgi:hypothetical protein